MATTAMQMLQLNEAYENACQALETRWSKKNMDTATADGRRNSAAFKEAADLLDKNHWKGMKDIKKKERQDKQPSAKVQRVTDINPKSKDFSIVAEFETVKGAREALRDHYWTQDGPEDEDDNGKDNTVVRPCDSNRFPLLARAFLMSRGRARCPVLPWLYLIDTLYGTFTSLGISLGRLGSLWRSRHYGSLRRTPLHIYFTHYVVRSLDHAICRFYHGLTTRHCIITSHHYTSLHITSHHFIATTCYLTSLANTFTLPLPHHCVTVANCQGWHEWLQLGACVLHPPDG